MNHTEYMRIYRQRHPEKKREADKRYWAAHKDERNAAERAKRAAQPKLPRQPRSFDQVAAFWRKVTKTDGCWLWTGARAGRATLQYGNTRWSRRVRYAHRVAYELLVGPVPDGLELDHLCRVPLCVNPAHLEAVTRSENVRRGYAARRTGLVLR